MFSSALNMAEIPYYLYKTRPALMRYMRSRGNTITVVPRRRVVRRAPLRRYAPRVTRGYPRGMQGELKAIDTTVAGANARADTTGDIALLNGCARGDDINERVGRQITIVGLQLKATSLVTAGTGVDQTHRLLIVVDKQANATAPAITDVLDAVSTTAFPKLENRNRFRILYDKSWVLSASAEAQSSKMVNVNIKGPIKVTFNNGDAGTIADITTNSIYALILGTEARGVTAGAIAFRCRVRYIDQ